MSGRQCVLSCKTLSSQDLRDLHELLVAKLEGREVRKSLTLQVLECLSLCIVQRVTTKAMDDGVLKRSKTLKIGKLLVRKCRK